MLNLWTARARIGQSRSAAKTLSYETLHVVVTFLVAYAIFSSASLSALFAIADIIIDLGLYYLHERVWAHIKWSR